MNFGTKFAQKGYFRSKKEKMHFCKRPWSLVTILGFARRADRQNGILITFPPSSHGDN